MAPNDNPNPPGWIGGFSTSNPAFAYPTPDLSSLPVLDNMANINFLQRQMQVYWPEFSWLTKLGEEQSRCYTQFAHNISRIGYTDKGRVYSIICPQQGMWIKDEICLNVEVTVTGQRGWVNEPEGTMAADMSVEGKIWFTPSQYQGSKLKAVWPFLEMLSDALKHPFPLDKENAIVVQTHRPGDPSQPLFPLKTGQTPPEQFKIPAFAKHEDEAYAVSYLAVQIGEPKSTNDHIVDEFNKLVMKAFNLTSGNMLAPTNILSWNVWFTPPELVNRKEWRNHAKVWRESIDAHHGSPGGPGKRPRYYNGELFENDITEAEDMIKDFYGHLRSMIMDLAKGKLDINQDGKVNWKDTLALGKELLKLL
jgi:hypothetical protein